MQHETELALAKVHARLLAIEERLIQVLERLKEKSPRTPASSVLETPLPPGGMGPRDDGPHQSKPPCNNFFSSSEKPLSPSDSTLYSSFVGNGSCYFCGRLGEDQYRFVCGTCKENLRWQ
jgi:hypothetical protein